MLARYNGTCPWCKQAIKADESRIQKVEGRWVHQMGTCPPPAWTREFSDAQLEGKVPAPRRPEEDLLQDPSFAAAFNSWNDDQALRWAEERFGPEMVWADGERSDAEAIQWSRQLLSEEEAELREFHEDDSEAFNRNWAAMKNQFADREREQEARAFLSDPW